jgi:hypothetical protein
MEALEQEVFKYKKMAEREVDIIHRINQELIAKHRKKTRVHTQAPSSQSLEW